MRLSFLSVMSFAIATPVLAETPRVVTDIAPVHSLVSMVMEGMEQPYLLLEAGASPHGYAMRPSDARALQDADLVVWIGESLTPWLAEAQETLSSDAVTLALIEQEGIRIHPVRDAIVFADDHAHDDEHGDHAHDDGHDNHNHDEDHKHDAHDHAHDDHAHDAHDHDHDHAFGTDPHAWLDPANARVWLDAIASALSEKDVENAQAYQANAAKWQAVITAAETEITDILGGEPVTGFAVYHDAFQYFERAFDVRTLTSLSASDAAQPSAARAAALGAAIRSGEVTCVFSEPQFADRAVRSITDGSDARVAVLDPLGVDLELGTSLYPALLKNIAVTVSDC